MSEVYIKEPATKGKVIIQTTHGDLEIELWSTETPKACRNFCTLILEGYYTGTIFHRVLKDFCIQGGDGTGTGDGCEHIYDKPYPDEINTRLKFRYRGMMGIASAGKGTKTNGSQFFIVLGRTPSLDQKHTLFAKVVGDTVYNLVRLSEVEVDKNDRPCDPPRILRAELVWDPFEDLEPRRRPAPAIPAAPSIQEHRVIPKLKKAVLSFAGGADSDEDDDDDSRKMPPPAFKGKKGISAHDLLDDPKLLKGAHDPPLAKPREGSPRRERTTASEAKRGGAATAPAAKNKGRRKRSSESSEGSDDDSSDGGDVALERSQKRQQEILNLKRSIVGLDAGPQEDDKKLKKPKTALEEQRLGYTTRTKNKAEGKEGRKRAAETVMNAMKQFQDRLKRTTEDMKEEVAKEDKEKDEKKEKKDKTDKKDKKDKEEVKDGDQATAVEEGTFAAIWREGEEESDANWLGGGGLKFHASGDKAFKMAAMKARENLEIFDPLLAKGNAEVLADARKKRSEQLRPASRRPKDLGKEKW